MNETKVELPSGGSAWMTTIRSHEQASELRKHHLRVGRYLVGSRTSDGTTVTAPRRDMTEDEENAYVSLESRTSEVYIRTLVQRWEGVTDAEGAPLAFPDDIGRMQENDFQALSYAVIFGERAADPNDSKASSGSSSQAESGPKTRTSKKPS